MHIHASSTELGTHPGMVTRCGAPDDRAWAPACGRGANGVVHKPSPVLGEMQPPPPPNPPPPSSPP